MTDDEAQETLVDAVGALAKRARGDNVSPSSAEHLASAARQLAEAYAWIFAPAQPHGGSASASD